jgi:hypothetical protein
MASRTPDRIIADHSRPTEESGDLFFIGGRLGWILLWLLIACSGFPLPFFFLLLFPG